MTQLFGVWFGVLRLNFGIYAAASTYQNSRLRADLEKNIYLWTLKFWEGTFGGEKNA